MQERMAEIQMQNRMRRDAQRPSELMPPREPEIPRSGIESQMPPPQRPVVDVFPGKFKKGGKVTAMAPVKKKAGGMVKKAVTAPVKKKAGGVVKKAAGGMIKKGCK